MPDIWEEVWKSSLGILEHRIDSLSTSVDYLQLNIVPDNYNIPPPHLANLFSQIEKLVYWNMVRYLFYESGWEPVLGQTFREESLRKRLGIQDTAHKYFGFILEVLEAEGLLIKQAVSNLGTEITWKLEVMPPSKDEVLGLLASPEFTSELTPKFSAAPLLSKVGENLCAILSGKEQGLNVLFPDQNQSYPSMAEFYTNYEQVFQIQDSGVEKNMKRLLHMQNKMMGKRFILRVLEIGAGTGSCTKNIIELFEQIGMEYEYTYTDISSGFFQAAEKNFENSLKSFKFRKLNIEEDPLSQGFVPEYFDYVIASDVLHATRNIQESLNNIWMLMKPHAKLDILEMTRPHRFVTFLVGMLEGFWRFEDLELRPRHCTLSLQQWASALESSGFEVKGLFPTLNNYHSYIWAEKSGSQVQMGSRVSPQNNKYWLIFDDNSQVSKYIDRRFGETTSRRVINVQPASKFEEIDSLFKIRKSEQKDFELLLDSLKSQKIQVEGIVYCWAIDSTKGMRSQEDILRPYFFLTQSMLTSRLDEKCPPRLIVITKGIIPVGNTDLSNFPASTICGYTKSLKNENHDMQLKLLDVVDDEGSLSERQLEEIYCELWSTDKEYLLAYRNGARTYPKIQPHKPKHGALQLPPGTDRFQLILPETRLISDLQFGPLDTTILKETEVEVQIKASALNFRDVFSVMKPSEQFKDINTVGFDMAGVVKRVGSNVTKWKVGDRVCGRNNYSALPSHVVIEEKQLMQVPTNMTLCEAATLPAVYMTSVVCLLEVAKIRKQDVVLLHTASGGVGLSAIEFCKEIGCTIIATAGSKRKQNYLRGLGLQHIFNSRSTHYGNQILEVTNGRGVDVVLNSLTSEGFKEATLKACAKGARFVEMSKLNIWKPEEVKELRPDVEYTIIDIASADVAEVNRMFDKVKELAASDSAKPIPYVRFDGLHVREALQHMQKAKHIGKIVCVMPELRNEGGEIKVYTPMFSDGSCYLITGGLGGIGFQVCKWMIANGAKHVLLASRSLPTKSMQREINELNNSKAANVIPVQLDVGDFEQCRELIQIKIGGIMGLPPLRGIMHAAGILADSLIPNMDWPKLSSTFHTKINGTLNLHELTKNLNLEHFVVFSSMAALLGPPGQCNHAAGNAFEDALVHYRNSIGLPATTINWGLWGEVGIATEVELPGVKTISNLQGLTGLEYVLKMQHSQLAIINVESFRMLSKLFPHLAVYLDENVWKSSGSTTSVTVKSEEFWQQYESKSELEDKLFLVKEQLKNILRNVLKLEEDINDNINFEEMGVDSLMFIEIKNCLQSLFGSRIIINATALRDSNTVNLLAETLVKLIDGHSDELEIKTVKPTAEQVSELIRQDCILPESIGAKPNQTVAHVRDIKRVFLAGATGTLGLYVLKQLSNSPLITQVICLMRKSKNETPDERLHRLLMSRELLPDVNMRKIRCVTGNVALANLGLEKDVWEELTGSVDAIFNCSARVQHNEQYRKRNSTTDVRAVNIRGIKNLLQFACEKKLKHVYQAASLLSVLKTEGEPPQVSENWPDVGDLDGVTTFAYPISKHVGDVLARQAMERGIPIKVFRFPLITGDSQTGACSLENNHYLLRYLFILKNGIMPSISIPVPMLPADVCAEVSVRVFFDERASSDVYNVGNAKVTVDHEFVNVANKFGHHVDIVELSEFLTRVKESAQQDSTSALQMFSEMYEDEEALLSIFANAPIIQRWIEGNEGIYGSNKIPALIPNFYENQRPAMDYTYTDLMFIKQKGWFDKFGL